MYANKVSKLVSVMNFGFPVEITKNLIKCMNVCLRNRSFNSQDWLERRKKDRYVEITKQQNYRCRSAFKLIEIDDRFKLIKPGYKVLDIGAAPGSWSQVLAERTNSIGKDENTPVGLVIAIDLSSIHNIDGVITLSNMDFTKQSSQEKIKNILGSDGKFDFIFSDMAPAATGVKHLDQDKITQLVYSVLFFSIKHLNVGSGCLVKMWDGEGAKGIKNEMKRFFKLFNIIKPKASYLSSSECFYLGRQFLGSKT